MPSISQRSPQTVAAAPEALPANPQTGVAFLLWVTCTTTYLAFRSNDHYFDSLSYALIVESGQNLFLQKHILQHATVWLLRAAVRALGGDVSALAVAQTLNAVLAGTSVVLVFLSLRRMRSGMFLAAAFAVVFGFVSVVSRHAVEGEVHVAPLCFWCLALWLALGGRHVARAVGVGLACALSVLMHETYVLLAPAVLGVLIVRRYPRLAVVAFVLGAALPVLGVYVTVFSSTNQPWSHFLDWARMEGGRTPFARSWAGAAIAWTHALSPSDDLSTLWRPEKLIPVSLLVFLAGLGVRRARHTVPALPVFAALAIGLYLPALVWHQTHFQYFAPATLPVVLLAAIGTSSLRSAHVRGGLAASLAVGYAALACVFTLAPAHDRSADDTPNRMAFIQRIAGPDDLVVVTGTGRSEKDPPYLRYFEHLHVRSLWDAFCEAEDRSPAAVYARLARSIDGTLAANARVLVFGEALDAPGEYPAVGGARMTVKPEATRRFMSTRYRLQARARYAGPGYSETLYEVLPRHRAAPCGPAPHFKLRDGRCLPSCGVLASRNPQRLAKVGCCAQGCVPGIALAAEGGETWDCVACCGAIEPDRAVCR